MSRRIRLGESLVAEGLITPGQLEEALVRTKETGERVGEALVALGYISEAHLVRTLARDADIPFLEADDLQVDSSVVSLIDAETARKDRLIPLRADGSTLVVAMSNPFDIGVIRALERATDRKIRTVTGDPAVIMKLVEAKYGNRRSFSSSRRPAWSSTEAGSPKQGAGTPETDDAVFLDLGSGFNSDAPAAGATDASPHAAKASIQRAGSARRRGRIAGARTFASLIGQDTVTLVEYAQHATGFRIVDVRTKSQRFASPDAALDALLEMLRDAGAKRASLTIALQHFGSFFKTLVVPSMSDERLRATILREVGEAAGPTPSIAFSVDDARPAGAGSSQHVFVAAVPGSLLKTISGRLRKAGVRMNGLTVVPEAFRHLYAALDGSSETTAVLVSGRKGPHVAFFVDGRFELSIEPAFSGADDAPVDARVIIDQLDRAAIFLRQEARGAVATRLLLSAPADAYEDLASRIEAHTGMRVAPLGEGIGAPDTLLAMGAVIAACAADGLDLCPPPSQLERGLGRAAQESIVSTALATAAGVAALWAAMQVSELRRERHALEALQRQVGASMPMIESIRRTSQARDLVTDVRTALHETDGERAAILEILHSAGTSGSAGSLLDSIRITRLADGMHVITHGRERGQARMASFVTPIGGK